jgi:hypothetical protein
MSFDEFSKKELLLSANVEVEVDELGFRMVAREEEIVVSVRNISEAFSLFRKVLRPLLTQGGRGIILDDFLRKTGKTVYIQNRYFGVLGKRANPVLKRLCLYGA